MDTSSLILEKKINIKIKQPFPLQETYDLKFK